MAIDARSRIDNLDCGEITSANFVERRWSYIGRSRSRSGIILKVPKSSESTAFGAALKGEEECRIASNEYKALRALARVNDDAVRVPEPLGLIGGTVLVTHEIPDLCPLARLLREPTPSWERPLGALGTWLKAVHTTFPGRIVDGLKLDNVEVDMHGRVVVFDPNELMEGPPVVDLARFCVTLLARDYERGALPRRRTVAQCRAFLAGYGYSIPLAALRDAAELWVRRLDRELRVSVAKRLGPVAPVASPWLTIHSRLLRRRLNELAVALRDDDTISGRYDDDVSAETYRSQQDTLTIRNLRLGLLARAEIKVIRRQLVAAGIRSRVLDLPAGTGKLWPLFASLGVQCVAGDLSVHMLRQGDTADGVKCVVMDARTIPFPDNSFEGVVSLRLFHRLPAEDRMHILHEFARVGSRWLVVSYAVNSGYSGVRYSLRTWFARSNAWAPHPIKRSAIRAELAVAGYDLVSVRSVASVLSNEVVALAVKRSHGRLHAQESPVCPGCRGSLNRGPDDARCSVCGRTYSVADGIPILIMNTALGKRRE